MTVNVKGGKLSKKEIEAYTTQLREANPDKYIKNVQNHRLSCRYGRPL